MSDPLDQYLAPPASSGVDPLDDALRQQRQAAASAALIGSTGNPDTAGKANALSRQVGLPAETVERNLPAIQQQQQQVAASTSILRANPKLADWTADPRNAAVASDDMGALAHVGRTAATITSGTPQPTLWNVVRGLGTAAVEGVIQSPSVVQGWAEDAWNATIGPLGWSRDPRSGKFSLQPMADTVPSSATIARNASRARVSASTPEFKSWWAQSLYGGGANLAQNALGLAASVATGSAVPALIAGSLQASSQAYGDIKDAGGSAKAAFLGRAAIGAIEAATEFLPTKMLTQGLGKLKAPKAIAEFLGKELLGEETATVTQNAVQTAATPGQPWGDYLKQLPADMRDTAVAVGMMGLTMHGVGRVAHHIRGNMADLDAAQRGANGVAAIDALMSEAAKSKTRGRDKEGFRQYVASHTENTPLETVYVTAERLMPFNFGA